MKKSQLVKNRKSIVLLITAILICTTLLTSTISQLIVSAVDPDLDKTQTTQNNHFTIYWTDDCTAHPTKCVAQANIDDLDDILEELYDVYTDPTNDYRFNDPTSGTAMRIEVLPADMGGISYRSGWIALDPDIFGDVLSTEAIPLHELLHQVQWAYGWDFTGFTMEGTARMMQDKIYNDLDMSLGTEMCAYFPEVNDFLGSYTDNTLIDLSYRACLFWTYLTEQYGSVSTEPQVGVDVVREVYENHDSGTDDIQRINAALSSISPGTDFKDVFMDFIVANYAKELTGPSVPDKYQYIDDDIAPGDYARPALTVNEAQALGDVENGNTNINEWSARYYEIRPSADVPIVNIEFTQTGASTPDLVYNLLVIDDGDLVTDLCEYNLVRQDYVRSIINDGYDRFVVVVGALDNAASYSYSLGSDGGLSTIDIKWPITGNPAIVDIDDLNTILVHVEVDGPTGSPLHGLDTEDFDVQVDGTSLTIITGVEVMNQYWLAVQPENLGAGLYDLRVELAVGTISDTENDAIQYRDEVNADNMIVIDRSGSMLQPDWTGPYWEPPHPYDKIYGAIDAASLFVNSFRTGDKIGLVWFSTDAYTPIELANFTEANRVDMINTIDTFDQDEANAWYATSIGDGLWNAQTELDNRGEEDHSWVIIVLSDGIENRDRRIPEVVMDGGIIDYVSSTANPDTTKTIIHTVALGSNADREKLEDLAEISGGRYEYVVEPASGDLPNDLADVYRLFAEEILLEERIIALRGTYHYDAPAPSHTIEMESRATEATFVVNYNWRGQKYGGDPEVYLIDPSGHEVTPTFVHDTHQLFRVPQPQSGSWTVILEQPQEGGQVEGMYLVEVSVKSRVNFEAFIANTPEERLRGAKIPFVVFLTDEKPITGATVNVELTLPDIEDTPPYTPSGIDTIQLYDDGKHGDGRADDGVYAGVHYNTDLKGIYDAKIIVEGTSPIVGSFRREATMAFNIKDDTDSDNDGLPDTWEKNVGLNYKDPLGDNGPNGDPDKDGLTNMEEFENGTMPLDQDTDNGGENDGSEVTRDRDPFDPEDDKIKPPTSIRAVPYNGYVEVWVGILPRHDQILIHRSTSPEGPWMSFMVDATPSFNDKDLENDVTYYYKAAGVTTDTLNRVSATTRTVSATPRVETIPPTGHIHINKDEYVTNDERVTLNIWADPDTVAMKISNNPELKDAEWEPYTDKKQWQLETGKGLRTVYMILKDEVGNIGPKSLYDFSGEVQPAMDTIVLREIEGVETTFFVDDLEIAPQTVFVGESVDISTKVINIGGRTGSYDVALEVNDVTEDEFTGTLQPNEQETISYTYTSDQAGTFKVDINGQTGSFTALKPVDIKLSTLEIIPGTSGRGETMEISVVAQNEGDVQGSGTVTMYIDETVQGEKTVILAPGASTDVVFEYSTEERGTYNVRIGDLTGSFKVQDVSIIDWITSNLALIAVVILVSAIVVWQYRLRAT